jgi:TolB-like protein/Flp pilus assembly protein TadD
MTIGAEPGVQMEIGHVLFMDIVGYSKLLLDQQRELQQQLNEIVRSSDQFRIAEAAGKLVRLPVGDGMALVFFNSPEAPVQCAVEISKVLRANPEFQLRMGIHSGPVNKITDVNDRANIAGAGINIAQRVMDCADGGHILLSKRMAEDLSQSRPWRQYLHDLGECSVKHGVAVSLVNLYTDEIGNPAVPEKMKKARQEQASLAGADTQSERRRRRRLLIGVAGLVMLAGAIAATILLWPQPSEKSIAVLPFENFSDNKENAFFADGIQDDILTSLARIEGLRVISRTSVMGYGGGKGSHNLREISKALKVANILEGSVRREGNRIAVTVQLIDARHDRHLWANRYERSLQDSLGLQGELAGEIADALRVKLTPEETVQVQRKPTNNAQAYELYLQARQYEFKPDTFLQDYRTAEQLYVQAITLDPNFALAHARLAVTRARIYHFYEPTETWNKGARAEAALALQLQPSLGEAHHALGLCHYWFNRDYASALREFEIAKTLLPNDSSIPWDIAAIERRQGRWQETVQAYLHILTLDPRNANVVRDLLYVYCVMRDWPNAEATAQRLLSLGPDSINAKVQIGYVQFWWKGTTERLKSEMATVPAGKDPDGAVTSSRMDASFIDRDAGAAERALLASPLENFSYFTGVDTPRSFFVAEIALLRGDNATAQKEFEHLRTVFASLVQQTPDVPERHAFLGLACAFLGEKDRAIAEGKRAVELRPESQDALDGPILNAVLAMIYARTGENDRALALLDHLLSIPGAVDSASYSITVNDLKYRWEWDSMRNDPRFQKLLQQ